MIIRSQDRKSSTDDINLYICEPSNEGATSYSICNTKVGNLGEYRTIEKAIKVLDEIGESCFKKNEVYDMPQDEDIEV